MRYTAQSSKYVLKNFFYIFPFAVIPALFLCFSTDQQALTLVLTSFFKGKIDAWDFSNVFRAVSILSFSSWKSIVFGVIGIVAVVVCVALIMALLEKHMRIGKRTFNGIFSKLNDNFIPTVGYSLLLLVMYELWALIASAVLLFISKIAVKALAYVCVVLAYVLMNVVLLYVIGIIYLWLPCMQITGFKAVEALQYSNHLTSPVKWKLVFGQAVCLFISELLICLCALLTHSWLWFALTTTLAYSFVIMVFTVRMEICYFDLDNIERMDEKKYGR